jgi:glycosyltransferase involved in cell wall biosynthesis
MLYRLALIFPNQVWFLNSADRDIFVTRRIISGKKARVIPGEGVDMERFAPRKKVASKKTVFLLIARIVADKGIREYVEASRILRAKKVRCECRLLGSFDDYPDAIAPEEVTQWEREGLVQYLGVKRDVRDAISEADCIVLPSTYREGVPRSLMEGGSMEKPLIATDIPGCRDLVREGVTGFLCKPGDALSLCLAMEKFAALRRAQRRAMGKNARKMIKEEFDEKIIADIYRDKVHEICGGLNNGGQEA